ncbi:MAG: hypothetical protein E7523_13030 [Ruminococcaceae bacterium]|nr:hypothetical protein [Oscillospiraceae bacterium]
MPYIKVTTTAKVAPQTAENLKADFGKAIENFPGKSEQWLMVAVQDNVPMWIRGDNSADTAMVDVELLGSVNADASNKMTADVCDILEKNLGIAPDRVYVKYTGYSTWGWNGGNF